MKFKFFCCIKEDGFYYHAHDEDGHAIILNVLITDTFNHDTIGQFCLHEFIIVVNKRGQLSCLCIK